MEFFIPAAKDKKTETEVYEAVKKHAEVTTSWAIKDRRIYQLEYQHGGKTYLAAVGKFDEHIGEPIVAILESTGTFLVCTLNRGVARGLPILVGKQEVLNVVNFADLPPMI
ncbi:hypothetical protein ACFL4X_00330 [Gemmatimonadota bacterium]